MCFYHQLVAERIYDMSETSIVPVKKELPSAIKKSDGNEGLIIINYEKADSCHYTFTCNFDEDMYLRMDEAEHASDYTDFVEAEYDQEVPDSVKTYYAVAAASGVLTGVISVLHLSEEQMKSFEEFKEKDWKQLIIKLANIAGYKKSDYKGASAYLVGRAVRVVNENDKTKKCFTVLAEHPTVVGLVFSILRQLSGKDFSLGRNGELKIQELPQYYTVGNTSAEKIVCAFFYWLFALAVEEAESKRRVIDNIGLPKELSKIIKEFANYPFFRNYTIDSLQAEEKFSEWLRETIVGAELYQENSETGNCNLLVALMREALNNADDAFPVLLNECIVRSLYILIRLCHIVEEKRIQDFDGLIAVSPTELLPDEGRVLSKMCLIASASFVGVNITEALLKALKGKKAKDKKFGEDFFAELNIAGIGRFLFACAADRKYWGEDLRVLLQKAPKNATDNNKNERPFEDNASFDSLVLDALQTRILYCLENIAVRYDIAHTKKKEIAEKKNAWLEIWKRLILRSIDVDETLTEQYFFEDEDVLYKGLLYFSQDKSNWRWLYLLTQELSLFKPYVSLGTEKDKDYKKLKMESDYVRDQFIRRQTVVSQDEVDEIMASYHKYVGYVSGSTQKKIIGVGAAAVAAVATGGVALTFAPSIAVAVAGEAVAGLHGIALTGASLAYIGGGALAAGGLGIAGGTAIITGGGALIGLVGTGSISVATILLQTPSEYWVRQSAKLLTYCNCVLNNTIKDIDSVKGILAQVENTKNKMEKDIKELEAEKNDLDKDTIRKMSEYVKYLNKCTDELKKIVK